MIHNPPWNLCKVQFINSLSLQTSYLQIVNACAVQKQGSGLMRHKIQVLAWVLSIGFWLCPASTSVTPSSSVFLNHCWFTTALLRSFPRFFFPQKIYPHKNLIYISIMYYRYLYPIHKAYDFFHPS